MIKNYSPSIDPRNSGSALLPNEVTSENPRITPIESERLNTLVTPPSVDSKVQRVTLPSKDEKITKGQALSATTSTKNASIFGAGLLGLLMLKLRNRRNIKYEASTILVGAFSTLCQMRV